MSDNLYLSAPEPGWEVAYRDLLARAVAAEAGLSATKEALGVALRSNAAAEAALRRVEALITTWTVDDFDGSPDGRYGEITDALRAALAGTTEARAEDGLTDDEREAEAAGGAAVMAADNRPSLAKIKAGHWPESVTELATLYGKDVRALVGAVAAVLDLADEWERSTVRLQPWTASDAIRAAVAAHVRLDQEP